jgi:hypothetical protein
LILIRAINIDPQAIHAVQIENGMPRLFSFSVEASELETAPSSALHGAQRIDKVRRRRAGTDTDNGPGCTYCSAAQPTAFFSSSCVMIMVRDVNACGAL